MEVIEMTKAVKIEYEWYSKNVKDIHKWSENAIEGFFEDLKFIPESKEVRLQQILSGGGKVYNTTYTFDGREYLERFSLHFGKPNKIEFDENEDCFFAYYDFANERGTIWFRLK